ncbi:hypothetical protein TNCV_2461681 [Trichonephila clavipes]|nr:hypothetical protein TNCV_2461681 [Trichonephila clavipes]
MIENWVASIESLRNTAIRGLNEGTVQVFRDSNTKNKNIHECKNVELILTDYKFNLSGTLVLLDLLNFTSLPEAQSKVLEMSFDFFKSSGIIGADKLSEDDISNGYIF